MSSTTAPSPRPAARRRRPARPARRGVALLLVLGVVIMASVLGYAMLSSAATQKQATTNAAAIAGAQGIAESGVNLAIHYLQHPDKAPDYPTTYAAAALFDRNKEFWRGTGGAYVDFGFPSVGSCRVQVERPNEANRWKYRITSFGRAPGSALERNVVATVDVNTEYQVNYAAAFTNDARLTNRTVTGDALVGNVYSNGALSILTGGRVMGHGVRRRVIATAVPPDKGWAPAPTVPQILPEFGEIRSYRTYEFPKGVTNLAGELTGITNIGPGFTHTGLAPTPGNAAGVYYVPGHLTLHGGAVINGTLIVEGDLKFVPALLGNEIRITRAQPGFPALIVSGNVGFDAALSLIPTVRVFGLTYVGGRVDTLVPLPLIPTLEVNGALLVNGTSPVFPTFGTAILRVNYNRELAWVPDFSEVGRTPTSIKMKSWRSQ